MNYKQFLGITLIWVSKFLLFTDCQTCNITIKDPQWNDMWYLHNPRTNGYDMNVLPAWTSCVNGTNVTVGVVDNGVQDHIDLNINRTLNAGYTNTSELEYQLRSRQSSWNWFRSPAIRKRQYEESLKHGTRVAGIVAAKKNEQGIIGIAFGATLADVRIASTSVFETFNASLLTHQSDVIDVYSCSFANFHTGTKTYALLPNQENALREGTTNGRGGLGSVYVFATGNSGGKKKNLFRDSCAYDRLVTNRYVISVAGIQHNLRKLPNGEACSAMMVAAFTTKPGLKRKHGARVITTDIGNKTTFNFNQNSAAAPMVSGAVALALSANPFLTYRDIMHLLVNTARSDLLQNKNKTKFFENAAGFNVSSYFGFGLLDIGALVERSKTWELVPDRQSCHSTEIVDRPLNRRSKYFVVKVNGCNVTYVEHIEVSLIVNHQHAGQIQWILVSPYGTKSTILPGRVLDQTTTMNLTVLTVQMWGENPEGYWRLKPKPMFGKTLDHGTVESAGLSIHGYTCLSRGDCLTAAEQGEGVWGEWLPWSRCRCISGQGTKSRRRRCNDNNNSIYCTGISSEKESCHLPECQSEIESGITSSGCPSPSSLTRRCVEQCSSDSDCSGHAKCCFNGCGHTCDESRTNQTRPTATSDQGITSSGCPSSSSITSRCVEQCSSDRDCSGHEKCCYNGCGHTCEESRTNQTTQTAPSTSGQGQTTPTRPSTSDQDDTTPTAPSSSTEGQTTLTAPSASDQDQRTQTTPSTSGQDQTTPTTPSSSDRGCSDKYGSCETYKTRMCLNNTLRNAAYAEAHCRKTCGYC
ncbi:unnamed protein product [Mytilus coruscus]|uniref:Furin n=1 Tax=Mytilus coruscus TaxID=42192 RepID=A0A6J8DJZ1_MYTCO|nr:unnamed protein product [Mytilus coruscus]